MMQWEEGMGLASPVYPVLDIEDIEYIVNEEKSSTLIVLGRKEGGHERLLGYSYAYLEDWGCGSKGKPRKQNGAKAGRHVGGSASSRKGDEADCNKSLYVAELFVVESERGLGFGELLLCETLRRHAGSSQSTRSHLFVSSRNISAVKCYAKFGYIRSQKPSGDDVHDLVMELDDCQRSAADAALRLEKRVVDGSIGERRRRTRASPPFPAMPHGPSSPTPHHNPSSHRHTPEPSGGTSLQNSQKPFPSDFSKVEHFSAARPMKNCSAGVKRHCRTAATSKAEPEAHELILGDLFEITTRNHHGYERKLIGIDDNSGSNFPLRADPSSSAFHGTPQLDGHRRKKRDRKDCATDGDEVEGCVGPSKGAAKGSARSHSSSGADPQRESAKVRGGRLTDSEGAQNPANPRVLRNSNHKCRFLLTGFARVALQRQVEEGIIKLGGQVSAADEFDASCTHIVCPFPLRTEKFLCGLASGKHLVHSTYIEQSVQCGHFLPEEGFEWVSIAASCTEAVCEKLSSSSLELAKAVLLWKEHRTTKDRAQHCDCRLRKRIGATVVDLTGPPQRIACFGGMVVMLIVSNQSKDSLKRLLEAGGATLCSDFRDPHRASERHFTHAIVSMELFNADSDQNLLWGGENIRQRALRKLKELEQDGVQCLREEFLLDLLTKGPALSHEAYLVHSKDTKGAGRRRVLCSGDLFEPEPIRSKKRPAM